MLKYHFTLQACETAQNFARAFGRRALDEHRVARETTQNSARALSEHV